MKHIITLSPVRGDEALDLRVAGKVVTINGEDFDFGFMEAGDILPFGAIDSDHFTGPVMMVGDDLHMELRLQFGPNAPHEMKFPDVVEVVADGRVILPLMPVVEPEPEHEDEANV